VVVNTTSAGAVRYKADYQDRVGSYNSREMELQGEKTIFKPQDCFLCRRKVCLLWLQVFKGF